MYPLVNAKPNVKFLRGTQCPCEKMGQRDAPRQNETVGIDSGKRYGSVWLNLAHL